MIEAELPNIAQFGYNEGYDGNEQYKTSLGHRIGMVLKRCLPTSWFNTIALLSIQLQAWIRPKTWTYWSTVTPMLRVGAIPLKNRNHPEQLRKLGIRAILSINETHEFEPKFFATPVQESEWTNHNITYLRLSSPDLEPVPIAIIAKAVDFIAEQMALGKPTYVHCTSGRGRSVSVVISYLTAIEEIALPQAVQKLEACRPQVMLSRAQMDMVKNYLRQHQKISTAAA